LNLAQRETKSYSVHLAKSLVAGMRKVARMHKNPIKSAGFKVLKAPDVPSVLIELGYVSNESDLKQLTSGTWQAKTAGAIAQSVDAFSAPGGGSNGWRVRRRGRDRYPQPGRAMKKQPQFQHKNRRFCTSGAERRGVSLVALGVRTLQGCFAPAPDKIVQCG